MGLPDMCEYANSGCNAPEGECLGLCMTEGKYEVPVFNGAARLRDELTKGQEPVYCVVTEEGTYEHHKEWVPNADCFVLYTRPFVSAPAGVQDVIREKLARFQECADDNEGADIGREWFDALATIGLLTRVQRSPAMWEMTEAGRAMAAAAPAAPADAVAKDAEWTNPNDKTQAQFLPHIGEQVLFCHGGKVYLGKHTGGSFKAMTPPFAHFDTWGCLWMYPPKVAAISASKEK